MTFHDPRQGNYIEIGPIGGAGGGKGGTGESTESPDNLRSKQFARIIDLIGEGPNVGIVGWTKGIFLDGVQLQNDDGSFNFSNAVLQQVVGYPDQPVMQGFSYEESPYSVGTVVKRATPVTQPLPNTNFDRVRVTMSVPSLQEIDDKGNIKGSSVSFRILVQNNGGGFVPRGDYSITGKTSSSYQRDIILTLPAPGPWDLRVQRLTADSTSTKLQNDLQWDSYFGLIDDKINYTQSHCVGIQIDAEQFGAIPARTYLVDGRIIQVPSNYDPVTRKYTGTWNGGFKNAWTNNPAWCLYDMLSNRRYGLGRFITPYNKTSKTWGTPQVDKWALYEVGQWCDQSVPDGKGGWEPRFVCNAIINSQSEAYDLLGQMAAIFRGFMYWSGGQIVGVADQPRTASGIYSPANVIDGAFNYIGSDIRSRHNQITARWHNGDYLGEERYSVAEDQDAISNYGIQSTTLDVLGATTESQALRAAKWMMYTENYEGEMVNFAVGLDGAWTKPGDIIAIADPTVGGERRGGRVVAATQSQVTLDSIVSIAIGQTGTLSCVIGEGKVETLRVTSVTNANGRSTLALFGAFTQAPLLNTSWVLATGNLQTTLWRTAQISDNDDGSYQIVAAAHNPSKWDYIEKNLPLSQPKVSIIDLNPPPVTNIKVDEALVQLSINTVSVNVLISWTGNAPYYDVLARPQNGNWQRIRSVATAYELQGVTEGKWEFQVTAVNLMGRKSEPRTVTKEIVGRFAPPQPPSHFRMVISGTMALFRWDPATEIDVIVGGHYELRHSPRTDGSARWDTATPVVVMVPGNATSTEAFYQPGTWFLKTFDIVNLASTPVAVVVTQTDETYQAFTRIEEDPAWTGSKLQTVVENHGGENWLVIDYGGAGGLWDDQTDLIDDWQPPAVDTLPFAPGQVYKVGQYNFANRIDLGGVFSTRLTLDMLASPYYPEAVTIDNRPENIDTWGDWDGADSDLDGIIRVEMRQTDEDPATAAPADWSEWVPFASGDHTGRAFEFRVFLYARSGQNVALMQLAILADMRNKVDENKGSQSGGVSYTGSTMTIPFNIKFYAVPAITVTQQNAASGDRAVLTEKTNTSFKLQLVNGATNKPAGTLFDWHAIGY